MKKNIILGIICIIAISAIGIYIGVTIFYNQEGEIGNINNIVNKNNVNNEIVKYSVEISSNDEKTTPNTLMIYKIYYTKCNHYITKYEQIDSSLVNLTKDEIKLKFVNWKINKFSKEEIELIIDKEEFCNEHYKIKLENDNVVIYNINEKGAETEIEQTEITTEYLTQEDILKLTTGIIVYGKENLNSILEDYE